MSQRKAAEIDTPKMDNHITITTSTAHIQLYTDAKQSDKKIQMLTS